jgi:endonuclease/exonuclease/phosphatase family metal-dependent hydrolase
VKEITFINSHFNHEGSVEEQAAKTIEIMPEPSKEAVLLLGDLGVLPGSKDLSPIEAKLIDTCEAVQNENSSLVKKTGTGRGRVDYVFFAGRSFSVKDVGLVPKEYWQASSHIGYFARIAFK